MGAPFTNRYHCIRERTTARTATLGEAVSLLYAINSLDWPTLESHRLYSIS